MADAREEVLRRIGTALAERPAPAPVARSYRTASGGPGDVDLFAERVADYRATVHRGVALAEVLRSRGVTRLVVPDGLPAHLLSADLPPDVEIVHEPVGVDTLDEVDAVLTTCAVAIAETGTVVLDHGPGQGPRALTLVPDHHVVVVRADQVVPGVPDAIAALDPSRPLTWISGPSATSDIELDRVEGVHGPRVLDVVLLDAGRVAPEDPAQLSPRRGQSAIGRPA